VLRAEDCVADATSRNKSLERILRIVLTGPMLLVPSGGPPSLAEYGFHAPEVP
ncbi:hypothetical protein TNCV_177311, partial [Trichonephila clavipes]